MCSIAHNVWRFTDRRLGVAASAETRLFETNEPDPPKPDPEPDVLNVKRFEKFPSGNFVQPKPRLREYPRTVNSLMPDAVQLLQIYPGLREWNPTIFRDRRLLANYRVFLDSYAISIDSRKKRKLKSLHRVFSAYRALSYPEQTIFSIVLAKRGLQSVLR